MPASRRMAAASIRRWRIPWPRRSSRTAGRRRLPRKSRSGSRVPARRRVRARSLRAHRCARPQCRLGHLRRFGGNRPCPVGPHGRDRRQRALSSRARRGAAHGQAALRPDRAHHVGTRPAGRGLRARPGGLFDDEDGAGRPHGRLGRRVERRRRSQQCDLAGRRHARSATQAPDLRPELVAPGVALLASAACPASGFVLAAAGGRFSNARMAGSHAVDFGPTPASVDDIAARWDQIAGSIEP